MQQVNINYIKGFHSFDSLIGYLYVSNSIITILREAVH